MFGVVFHFSLPSYPRMWLVGHLPLSSADTELGAEGSLSPNLLLPEQGAALSPILVTPVLLVFTLALQQQQILPSGGIWI